VYVADAHALAWYFTNDARLGSQASRVFDLSEKGECLILIPTVVLAELFHISRKRRITLRFEELLEKVERETNFVVTDLDLATIKVLPQTLPLTELHDQIIVATALIHDAKGHQSGDPYNGYYFKSLKSWKKGGNTTAYDEGGGRNRSKFGVVAYPAEYSASVAYRSSSTSM